MKKKVLVVSYRIPYPLNYGFSIRAYNICKLLSKEYNLDLLTISEGKIPVEHIEALKKIFEKVTIFSHPKIKFWLNAFRGLILGDSLQTHYHLFRDAKNWLLSHYREYDLIFGVHMRMGHYLNVIKDIPVAIDFIDAVSLNYQEAGKVSNGTWGVICRIEASKSLRSELQMIKTVRKAFVSSQYDLNWWEQATGGKFSNLSVLPNGVKEELFERPINPVEEQDAIFFIGSLNYPPNVDGICYFAEKVFPLIQEKAKVELVIVGTNPVTKVMELQKSEGIKVLGYVPDPYVYMERAKVCIAPLRFSSGIQNKVLESMCLSKPVVMTSKASRGIEGKDGVHFAVADEPEQMAFKILELFADEKKRRAIGQNARDLIFQKYRWGKIGEALYRELEEVFEKNGSC